MREIGPPDQSPRDLQWPLAQARPSAELKKKRRPSQTQFSISLRLPNYTSSTQVTSSLRNSIAVSPSLLPAWGFGTAPAQARGPKSDRLLAGAGNNKALRGGRLPSLASLVADWCFLSIVRYSNVTIQHGPFLDRKSYFSRICVQLLLILFNCDTLCFSLNGPYHRLIRPLSRGMARYGVHKIRILFQDTTRRIRHNKSVFRSSFDEL